MKISYKLSNLKIPRPTEAEFRTVIQQLRGDENKYSYMQLEKESLSLNISPVIDAENLDLLDRLSIRVHTYHVTVGYLFLHDITIRDYSREIYYEDSQGMVGHLHETLPFDEAYKHIMQLYKDTRFKNYFRENDMQHREIWYCAYQLNGDYSRFVEPSVKNIVNLSSG